MKKLLVAVLFILACSPKEVFSQGINDLNDDGVAYMHLAAVKGDPAIMEQLRVKGADLNIKSRDEKLTPFMVTCLHLKVDAAKYLITNKAKLNEQDADGRTGFHLLALSDTDEAAQIAAEAYKNGGDITIKDNHNIKATTYAAMANNTRFLKAVGITTDLKKFLETLEKDQQSAVIMLAIKGQPIEKKYAVFETLFQRWQKDSYLYKAIGVKPAHSIIWLANYMGIDDLETLDLYIKYLVNMKGVNINDSGFTKMTALHLAAEVSTLNAVKALVANGANKEAKDINNRTTLDEAKKNGKKDIADYLLDETPHQKIVRIAEAGIKLSNFDELLNAMSKYILTIQDEKDCMVMDVALEDIYTDPSLYTDISVEQRDKLNELANTVQKKRKAISSPAITNDDVSRLEQYTESRGLKSEALIDKALDEILGKTAATACGKDFLALESVMKLINDPSYYPGGKFKSAAFLDCLKSLSDFKESISSPIHPLYNKTANLSKFEKLKTDVKTLKTLIE